MAILNVNDLERLAIDRQRETQEELRRQSRVRLVAEPRGRGRQTGAATPPRVRFGHFLIRLGERLAA